MNDIIQIYRLTNRITRNKLLVIDMLVNKFLKNQVSSIIDPILNEEVKGKDVSLEELIYYFEGCIRISDL